MALRRPPFQTCIASVYDTVIRQLQKSPYLGKGRLHLRVIVDHCKFWGVLILFYLASRSWEGGTLDFKWQQHLKDFSGFEIFSFGMLLGRKILVRIFWGTSLILRRDFFGCSKLNGPIFVLYHLMLSGKFLWFGNSVSDFWGIKFWCRDFFGFWFLPPFDHPCHLKSGGFPPPPGSISGSISFISCMNFYGSSWTKHGPKEHENIICDPPYDFRDKGDNMLTPQFHFKQKKLTFTCLQST